MGILIDLSQFRQNFIKDSKEEFDKIDAQVRTQKMGVGSHESILVGVFESKNGKVKIVETYGGAIAFSFVARNSEQKEHLIYICIPIVLNFVQALEGADHAEKYGLKKTISSLQKMGLDPLLLREAIILTDAKVLDSLIGLQFVVSNYWDQRALHIEYDIKSKCYFFVNSHGERFSDGELSFPYALDFKEDEEKRYAHFIEIASNNGYKFVRNFYTDIKEHSTANNERYNEILLKACKRTKDEPLKVINKTLPPNFPPSAKKTLNAVPNELPAGEDIPF